MARLQSYYEIEKSNYLDYLRDRMAIKVSVEGLYHQGYRYALELTTPPLDLI